MIIAGGVLVGFLVTVAPLRRLKVWEPRLVPVLLLVCKPGVASPVDSSFGFGNAVSSATVVQAGATILTTITMASTSTASATQPSTTVVKPNSPGVQSSSTTTNTSGSSGFIEFFSNVTVRVSSLQTSLSNAMAIAYTYGGYVAYSSYNNFSSIAVLRIPAANYQDCSKPSRVLG